ncbi:hypothetical protein ColTof4_02593 [Colletotrichum tofieldiae]|nr:hypothetical protein ColTof3_09114 [Colletotrichum tofieldiae]GKT70170.1 hypothetical protein ColTof4_02593 [Colletotrichum tofieldiae]GKT93217.1 hypothetical protein Ct61P_11067 [Colletotrichum tofieldiae]
MAFDAALDSSLLGIEDHHSHHQVADPSSIPFDQLLWDDNSMDDLSQDYVSQSLSLAGSLESHSYTDYMADTSEDDQLLYMARTPQVQMSHHATAATVKTAGNGSSRLDHLPASYSTLLYVYGLDSLLLVPR